jgi:hypothetical protein
MKTTYQIRILDGTNLKGIITDMVWMDYIRKVNSFGLCRFIIPERHQYAAEIQKNRRIEIWRKPDKGVFYREAIYIIRGMKYSWNGMTNDLLVTAVSGNWLLATRHVFWKAGIANRSTFDSVKAETVAKSMVRYNLTSDATIANGRIVAGDLSSVSVEADASGGNTIDWNCAYDNLLTSLQGVADIGGGDFDLTWAGTGWVFCWHTGQLGTDRSASLVFALERGNLEKPSLTFDWLNEKTLAAVGGQGEGTDRNVRTRQGAEWSTTNQIEVFVDARDVEAGAVNEADLLDKRADAVLETADTRGILEFEITQSDTSRYGVDYVLGDLGTVLYATANATVQISDVQITFAEGKDEVIKIGVKNV